MVQPRDCLIKLISGRFFRQVLLHRFDLSRERGKIENAIKQLQYCGSYICD